MSNLNKEVTIVIKSHKSRTKVINLISKISNNLKIVVIENSYDKSLENEISELKKNIKLIFSKNNGYGSAINLARTYVDTKYFFVLKCLNLLSFKFSHTPYDAMQLLSTVVMDNLESYEHEELMQLLIQPRDQKKVIH